MIDVTILWDDGTMFLAPVDSEDVYERSDALDAVWDQIHQGEAIRGRWMAEDGPQEQFRLVKLEQRGIRCVMMDTD